MAEKRGKVPFEEAMTQTGFGKFNWLAFVLCSSIVITMTFELFSVSYVVPASGCELKTSSAQQGMIAGVPQISILATSHLWGYLADTQGRRKILIFSLIFAYITGSLAAFSPNWIVLGTLKFCSSAAVSGAHALCLTLLSEYCPRDKRSMLIMLTTSVFHFGFAIMAVVAIPILPLKFSYYISFLDIHFNSWRLLNMIFALPAVFSALGVFWAYESPKYLLSVGKDAEALKVMKGIFEMNSGKDGDFYPVNSVILCEDSSSKSKGFWSSVKAQTLPMMKPPLLKYTLIISVIFFTLFFCVNPFIVWLPFTVNAFMSSVEKGNTGLTLCEMMRLSRNSSSSVQTTGCAMNSSAIYMVFGINLMLAIINLVYVVAVNFLGRKRLFFSLQLLGSVAVLAINFSTMWMISAFCTFVFLTGTLNLGSLTTFTVDVFPTYVKAMAVCLTLMVGRGSAVLGINLLKSLLDRNCEAAFYIYGCLTMAGAFICLLLPSDKKIAKNTAAANQHQTK